MNALPIYTNDLETQYMGLYTTSDSKTLYQLTPISKVYHIPRHQTKDKHLNACEKTIDDLFVKYNLTENDRWDRKRRYDSHYDSLMKWNGNTNLFADDWRGKGESYRAFDLNKAYEKVMKWNTTKILLYIIEARTRYKSGESGSRYNVKYDNHLFEFCCLFASYYYSKEDLESKALNLVHHLYDTTSLYYDKLTNYISAIPELKYLRAMQNGTFSLTVEQFKRYYRYQFGQ